MRRKFAPNGSIWLNADDVCERYGDEELKKLCYAKRERGEGMWWRSFDLPEEDWSEDIKAFLSTVEEKTTVKEVSLKALGLPFPSPDLARLILLLLEEQGFVSEKEFVKTYNCGTYSRDLGRKIEIWLFENPSVSEVSTKQVAEQALCIERPSMGVLITIGSKLREFGWQRKNVWEDGHVIKKYFRNTNETF